MKMSAEVVSTPPPPVVVIGAGLSGLPALKSCLEEGLPAICFEREDSIGGLWKFRDDRPSCMKTTLMNTSKELTSYSDFPCPDDFPNYMSHAIYCDYLELYVANFKLMPHIHLQHEVVSVKPAPDYSQTGRWMVKVKNTMSDRPEAIQELTASAVMICTGVFRDPCLAQMENIKDFEGERVHSQDLKVIDRFDDKRILVIGGGNSAGDAAVEMARHASVVYWALRPDAMHISRLGANGYPVDVLSMRRSNIILEKYLPTPLLVRSIKNLSNLKVDRKLYNLNPEGYKVGVSQMVVNDFVALRIAEGKIQIKNPVHRFLGDAVYFVGEEDKPYPLDAVVLATGYKLPSYPFLEGLLTSHDILYGLYRRVFPVALPHPTLAFIGCLKCNGPMATAGEIQARWAVQILAKKMSLPPKHIIDQNLAEYARQTNGRFLAYQDQFPYVEEVAELIGAKPKLWKLFFMDPKLFFACFFGPLLYYQYRLNGPHPWKGAREAILTVEKRIRAPFHTRPQYSLPKDKSKRGTYLAIFGMWAVLCSYVAYYWQIRF